jgi:alpha-ketoglutarate-dependent taurine dioxygenase
MAPTEVGKWSDRYDRFGLIAARPVAVETPSVRIDAPERGPALLRPSRDDVNLPAWCLVNASLVESLCHRHGGIRFRGFSPNTKAHFRALFQSVSPSPMDYRDRSSPRSEVEERLYTSTDQPASERIRMHCELSYSHKWPTRLALFCEHPAAAGGETPLADTRLVLHHLSSATRDRFTALGVRYGRVLREGIGLSWRDVFGVDSREAVELHCRQSGIAFQWLDDALELEWTRPSIRQHPRTAQPVWFNHAAFFHRQALAPAVAAALGDEPPPFWSSFGDGSPISADIFAEIEEAYDKATIVEPWIAGDIVLLDNMLLAHGRRPFNGRRAVYVMMGAPMSDEEQPVRPETSS